MLGGVEISRELSRSQVEENPTRGKTPHMVQRGVDWGGIEVKLFFFFFQAEDGIRDIGVTGVQTCALPILKYQTENGGTEFAWNTSWGVSTRLVGGLVMTHGDDSGLRIPPLLAPIELVIVPIWRSESDRGRVLEAAQSLARSLGDWERREPNRLRIHVDARDNLKPGAKYYEWELRGVPLRLELGPRDVDGNQAVLVRRDTREKRTVSLDVLGEEVEALLERDRKSTR